MKIILDEPEKECWILKTPWGVIEVKCGNLVEYPQEYFGGGIAEYIMSKEIESYKIFIERDTIYKYIERGV